ncbi:MAG: DNA-processing protein DprA [candidate division Zixibacteria bacterium]|nr:DNA-processing protein DprA [candidate division Zixibacteria bacterium]
MDSSELKSWLALFTVPNIGPVRYIFLVKHFGSPEKVLFASKEELAELPNIGPVIASNIKNKVLWDKVEEQLKLIQKNQVQVVTFKDENYPQNLLSIYDPPPFLFVKGEIKKVDRNAVAIVGCRLASPYGKRITERIGRELSKRGITIVSGLAWGIDSIGHLSALKENGRTLAVFGSGLDIIYPRENRRLAEQIQSSGAILSEFFLGTKPEAPNFPRRNRLISGLSLGVVIVEAGTKSGALLTAHSALEQNREVFAIPGNLGAKNSEGTNELIKQGAKLVTSVVDILEELRITTKEGKSSSSVLTEEDLSHLSEMEKNLFKLISDEPYHIDKVATQASVSVPQALSALLSLELKGLVKQLSGKMFVRA